MHLFQKNCLLRTVVVGSAVLAALLTPPNIFSETFAQSPRLPGELPDSIPVGGVVSPGSVVVVDAVQLKADSLLAQPVDTVPIISAAVNNSITGGPNGGFKEPEVKVFNPDPQRAVWLSALFPGLGQIYNRRYWKLPIIVGGFMGLGYGTSWNNMMLRDYTRGYHDLMDNDPSTKSYMDFFPPTTQESDLDKQWLQRLLKSRKDYYRRNRDLCIISMVAVYILAMVDAYVDASLSHFDISPDLSMDVQPAIIPDTRSRIPGFGLQWAVTF